MIVALPDTQIADGVADAVTFGMIRTVVCALFVQFVTLFDPFNVKVNNCAVDDFTNTFVAEPPVYAVVQAVSVNNAVVGDQI